MPVIVADHPSNADNHDQDGGSGAAFKAEVVRRRATRSRWVSPPVRRTTSAAILARC